MAWLPLTPAAIQELLSLPCMEPIPKDGLNEVAKQLGWKSSDLVDCAERTRSGHVLWASNYFASMGDPESTFVLTFANTYPENADGSDDWADLMQEWGEQPDWLFATAPTTAQGEAVFAEAVSVVTAELGPPLRTARDGDHCLATDPPYTIWRWNNHGLVVGHAPDNGPYGNLTMGVLALPPMAGWRGVTQGGGRPRPLDPRPDRAVSLDQPHIPMVISSKILTHSLSAVPKGVGSTATIRSCMRTLDRSSPFHTTLARGFIG